MKVTIQTQHVIILKIGFAILVLNTSAQSGVYCSVGLAGGDLPLVAKLVEHIMGNKYSVYIFDY
tara:strand:- start:695 stop:886 length:192 start_codon:yes stop_codon:yes gene_type:complete